MAKGSNVRVVRTSGGFGVMTSGRSNGGKIVVKNSASGRFLSKAQSSRTTKAQTA